MHTLTRKRSAWWLPAAAVLLLVVAATGVPAGAAWTVTVAGVVFYDRDNDGIRDPDEPGRPGIRVRHGAGTATTLTNSDGFYRLDELPAHGNVIVETGWFRSVCPPPGDPATLDCPPGGDNRYPVVNQFLRLPLTGLSGTIRADAGLLPDWPSASLRTPAGRPTVPANQEDVAARLSWTAGTCAGGDLHICRAGDTFTLAGQIHNQGTTPLTGIRSVIVVPAGDCLTDVSLVAAATSADTGVLSTSPPATAWTCATRIVEVTLSGRLVPAGLARLAITATTVSGPGTPGCTIGRVDTATCSTAEPNGRGWLFAVSRINQHGDPDSDFCAAADPRRCPTGLHDKRREPDEVDPVGHNVDAALLGPTGFHLAMALQRIDTGPVHPGTRVRLRAWVFNGNGDQAVNRAPPGSLVAVHLPPGTSVDAMPPRHALLSCTDHIDNGPVVQCRLRGPLSPNLSSPAIDLTVTVPSGWPAGHPYQVRACVQPAAAATAAPGRCGGDNASAPGPSDRVAVLTLPVT